MSRVGLSWVSLALGLAAGSCGDDGGGGGAIGVPTTCGTWVRSRFTSTPPADAVPYGHEDNTAGSFDQYVCRFRDEVDGKPMVLQGKGVYGFSCYAVLPPGQNPPPRVQPSADFEVLTGTKDCARMVPLDPSLKLLQTGVDNAGAPTYSCHASVDSVDVPGKSTPLGRFDPVKNKCVFEWYSNVREAPTYEAETFEVLAEL